MSVLKSHRKESSAEFLDKARELEIYSLRCCSKFPKKMTFYLSQPIFHLSQDVLNHVKAANSIYPTNEHEVQLRTDHLIEANNALQAMLSQLDIAHGAVGDVPDRVWSQWVDLIDREAVLIAGVKRSDKKRYASILQQDKPQDAVSTPE